MSSRRFLITALMALTACVALAQTRNTPVKKKTVSPSATKRATGKSTKVALTSASSRHVRSAAVTTRKVVVTKKLVHGRWVRTTHVVHSEPGPTYQTHPDQDRYQQIQQALAQKGYFKGEPNGQWNDDSVAALKQFQTESKLPNDGKISSLSLIGLGLGPTRETTTALTSSPAPTIK